MKKKIDTKIIFNVLIVTLLFGCASVSAAIVYNSRQISYTKNDTNVNNVGEALDNLYSMKTELDELKNSGNANSSDIAKDKTAVVKGELITGTAPASGMTVNNISFSASISSNGDGANGASARGNIDFNVTNYNTVTFGTITTTQSGTYGKSSVNVKLDGTAVSVSSNKVIDVSGKTTMTVGLAPDIYGNAGGNRSGSATISSITFN